MSFTAAPQRTRPDVPAAKHSWPKCVDWGQDQGAQLSASLQTCKQCLQFSFVPKSHTQNASGVLVSHAFMLSAYKIFFPPLHFRKMRGKISVKFLQRLEPKQIEKEPQSLTLYYSKCVQNYYSSLMRQLKNGDQGHARIFPICISWLQLPKEQCCLIISFLKSSGGFN